MAENRLIVEVEVDPDGKASVSLKNLEGDINRFAKSTDNAGQSGLRLRDVFAGNLLSDFFQRGVAAAVQFGAASVQASAAASDSNRQLEFSATQAGLSYTRAAAAAEDFGKRVGASNTEAARTFSDLIRLADRAGRPQDIELIGRRFADLAAARGLKGAELSNLIGTILSGQDEGLNRLGLPDPSKLYAQYAASIGKTAESLTEMEKAQAALNGVMAKGAEAEGEAEKRLRSTAGQLDTTAAAYENLKTQVGDAITTSVEFRNLLDTISAALGSVVTSHAEARRELAKGLKTPEQIAQEERDSFGRKSFDSIKGGASALFGIPTLIAKSFGAGSKGGADDFNSWLQGYIQSVTNPGQLQVDARTEQLRGEQMELVQQSIEAGINQLRNALKAQADAQRTTRREQFSDTFEDATKEENLAARLDKLRAVRAELDGLKNDFDAGDFEKRSKKIDEAIKETSKQVTAAVRTARDAVRDFLGESLAQTDKDNPFVGLFVRARNEVEETRQRFLIFGDDFATLMAQVKKQSIDAEIGVARLQSSLSALKYEQEARRLEASEGLSPTGPEERRLAVVDARIAGIEKDSDLSRRQRFLENPYRGFDRIDAERQNQQTLNQILALDVSGAGRGGREAQAQAVLNLLNQFDPRQVATSGDPFFRQLRQAGIGAYQVQRDALKANVEDTVQREKVGNLIQQDAREALEAVRASGANDPDKVKEYLRITSELSEKELTPDLRQGRIDALREQQRIEGEKEKQGEQRAALFEGVMKKLDNILTDKGLKLDAAAAKVQIEVTDQTGRANVTGDAY